MMALVHSAASGSIPIGDEERAVSDLRRSLDHALDAFDRLYSSVCGDASIEAIRDHFGSTAAFEIRLAKQDIERVRAALPQPPEAE